MKSDYIQCARIRDMDGELRILGIPGSLRKRSYNRLALEAAQKFVPQGARLEIFGLEGIPPYNQDLENPVPSTVAELKAKIRAADAVLFATPEYNYSFSGVLKNAIDWASRPYGESAWNGKPTAIMGASTGSLGSARAQYHLRQVLVTLNMYTLNRPEVMIARASEKFDNQGSLTDEKTKEKIADLVRALVVWTRQLKVTQIAATT
jgi:chromate reductase, NAD(P)H dehydrogenase (quinone)